MIPTWRELGRRIAWLAFHRYREIRRTWRHWRVGQRRRAPTYGETKAIFLDSRPGVPIRMPSLDRIYWPVVTIETIPDGNGGLERVEMTDYTRQQALQQEAFLRACEAAQRVQQLGAQHLIGYSPYRDPFPKETH